MKHQASKLLKTFSVIGVLTLVVAANVQAEEIKLNPGPIPGKVVHNSNAHNYAYCEIAPVLGTKPNLVAQFYNTSEPGDACPLDKMEAIDSKKLAEELGADFVYMNPTPQSARRHWVMDELWIFKAGEIVDFHGVTATWMASMTPEVMKGMVKANYYPGEIHRESKYLYKKGTQVYLLRTPDKISWVMQSYATEVDKDLNIKQLPQLADKLKNLPDGWTFEVKTLEENLTIDPRRADGVAHIVRDELHNVYEGCGFDATCDYTP